MHPHLLQTVPMMDAAEDTFRSFVLLKSIPLSLAFGDELFCSGSQQ